MVNKKWPNIKCYQEVMFNNISRAAESCPHRPHVGSKACMVLVRKWLGGKKEREKKEHWGKIGKRKKK